MKLALIKIIRNISLYLMTVTTIMVCNSVHADANVNILFQEGKSSYQDGNYKDAIKALEEAVVAAPNNSEYHHWLGKAYGQLAQQSSLLSAYKLSVKTRKQLERAVDLDKTNVEAMADLLKFYELAPEFLGGGEKNAQKIRIQLHNLNYNVVTDPEV